MATDDPIFAMNVDCPKFNQLLEELETSDFFSDIYKNNSDLLDNLTNFTGMTVSSLGDIRMIFEVLYIYRNHNDSYLPDWIDDIDQDKLTYLAGLGFAQATFTEKLRRLRSGPFFDYLISYFNDVINNATDVMKVLMLSGHDTTISAALGGMELFDNDPPEFTSSIIWELRRNSKKEYIVNVLYKKNSTDAYKELYLKNCDFDCPFNDFKTNLASITVDSETWQDECKESGSVQFVLSSSLLIIVITLQIGA